MCDGDDANDKHECGESGTRLRKPEHDKGGNENEHGLDVIIQGDARDDQWLWIEEIQIDIGGDDGEAA